MAANWLIPEQFSSYLASWTGKYLFLKLNASFDSTGKIRNIGYTLDTEQNFFGGAVKNYAELSELKLFSLITVAIKKIVLKKRMRYF